MAPSSYCSVFQRTGGLFGQEDSFHAGPVSPLQTTITSQTRPLRFSEAGSEDLDSPVFYQNLVFFPPPRRNRNTNNSTISRGLDQRRTTPDFERVQQIEEQWDTNSTISQTTN
ncbi:unnamed protein product [Staurois parvus]|uniref:Uncharacterized protein n=1 Tax=Staurois parvus TaxID=386267 RepID=A0ABN9F9I9_9NEOB|nr:unnamed protein product [Staurois parvus]